jgi:hypothetical protein
MPIKAVDSDEVAFEASVRVRLPLVESIMIANGLDPSSFKITKAAIGPAATIRERAGIPTTRSTPARTSLWSLSPRTPDF